MLRYGPVVDVATGDHGTVARAARAKALRTVGTAAERLQSPVRGGKLGFVMNAGDFTSKEGAPPAPGAPAGMGASGGRGIFFEREEWRRLVDLYGRMVAAGEWRDYRLERGRDEVSFLVYRGARELPAYRLVKTRAGRRGGGGVSGGRPLFLLVGMDNRIIRRGERLASILAHFERRLMRLWARAGE